MKIVIYLSWTKYFQICCCISDFPYNKLDVSLLRNLSGLQINDTKPRHFSARILRLLLFNWTDGVGMVLFILSFNWKHLRQAFNTCLLYPIVDLCILYPLPGYFVKMFFKKYFILLELKVNSLKKLAPVRSQA